MEYIGRVIYGDETLEGIIPKKILEDGRLIECCAPGGHPPIKDVRQKLKEAMSDPIGPEGMPSLEEIVQSHYKGGLCTILVDDHTRENIHTRILLPMLLEELQSLGIEEENLRILVAGGTHRPPSEDEYPKILSGDVWPEHRDKVAVHDSENNLISLGEIDGVPVEIDKLAYDSEIIVPLTDLDYHYFAGLGGGPKQICPGICGEKIITYEHLKMFGELGFAQNVESGTIDGNPVFQYKIKIVGMIVEKLAEKGTSVYSILCTVDHEGRLVQISGGDIFETHKRDRPILDKVYVLPIDREADVTIVSAMSKGIDVYQAGKAVNSACRATKRGGRILLVAPCPDGLGSEAFRELMSIGAEILERMKDELKSSSEPQKVIDKGLELARREVQKEVMRDFKIGKHKPVDLLRILEHVGWGHLYIVQEGLSPEEKRLLPFEFVGEDSEPPMQRIRNWVEELEKEGRPDYLIMEDPGFLLEVTPS